MKKLMFIFLIFITTSCSCQNFFWSHTGEQFTSIKYGYLYNWWAVVDNRNISAIGWHIPTTTEWSTLVTDAGGANVAGGKLKAILYLYWSSPNTDATDIYGFNGRGGGRRNANGTYGTINLDGVYSTTSVYNATYCLFGISLSYNSATATVGSDATSKNAGFSVRPIKDSTTLSHGQSGIYTGNDGKVYRTICINGVEYLADNLSETKYRNGDLITVVTDNAAWAALTTEARCVYGNDENNR